MADARLEKMARRDVLDYESLVDFFADSLYKVSVK